MKRQYIKPSVLCVKIELKRAFLQVSNIQIFSDDTISKENEDTDAGWAREDNTDTNNNRTNVWDNIW